MLFEFGVSFIHTTCVSFIFQIALHSFRKKKETVECTQRLVALSIWFSLKQRNGWKACKFVDIFICTYVDARCLPVYNRLCLPCDTMRKRKCMCITHGLVQIEWIIFFLPQYTIIRVKPISKFREADRASLNSTVFVCLAVCQATLNRVIFTRQFQCTQFMIEF